MEKYSSYMNGIKHLLLIIFCVMSHITLSQVDKTYDYLPPSPTAAELGKYGLSRINLSTGAMVTSVPIYTLKTANLSVPITLNYSSNGVKVDQIASNVGMNWSSAEHSTKITLLTLPFFTALFTFRF